MKKNQLLRRLAVAALLKLMFGPVCARADTVYATIPTTGTVDQFTPGGVASVFAADPGDGSVLSGPQGLAFDSAGNLYVASNSGGTNGNGSIEKFTPAGVASVFASDPGDGSVLTGPEGLAFDIAGNLYVANDGGWIEKFTTNGTPSLFASDPGDGSILNSPNGLAFDSSGNLYVANFNGGTNEFGSVEKFAPNGASSLIASDPGDGSVLNGPEGLAFDNSGILYVVNFGGGTNQYGSIEKFTTNGTPSLFASDPGDGSVLFSPTGLAFDSAGNLYVVNFDSRSIEKFDKNGNGSKFASGLNGSADIAILQSLSINNLNVTAGPNSATITWTTSIKATAQVLYGTTQTYGSSSALNTNLKNSQAVFLTGLMPNTFYYFQAVSTQGTNVVVATGSFTTGISPLSISNLNVGVGPSSAIITWATSANATAQVQYGTTPAYGSSSVLNANLTNSQAVLLTGLMTNTVYYFQAVSTQSNNVAVATGSFSTGISSSSINNLNVTVRPNSAIITWSTSANATAQVQYGTSPAFGSFSALNTNLTTSQAVLLTGLTTNTVYYFQAVSIQSNNVAVATGSFSTDVSLVVQAIQATFAGVWTLATAAPDKYSTPYKYSSTTTGSDSAEAFFRPNIITSGYYDLYIWYSEGTNRSTNVPVLITYQDGYVQTSVNQTLSGGSWQLLTASQYFAAGTNAFVRIGNGTGESNKVVIADAVQWVYNAAQDSAANGIIPAWWANYFYGTNTVDGSALGSNGYTLLADYVIGLSPIDPGAHMNLSAAPIHSGFEALFSPWQGGRIYGLQSATTLVNPTWTAVPNLTASENTNGQGVIVNTNLGGAKKFIVSRFN